MITEAWFQSHSSLCGICGEKSGTATGFSQKTLAFFVILQSRGFITHPHETTIPIDSIPYHSHSLIRIIHRIYHIRCQLFKYPGALKCQPFKGSTALSFTISVKKKIITQKLCEIRT